MATLLILIVNALYAFSSFLFRPVVTLYAESMDLSTLIIGVLISANSFIPMLLAIQTGKWVDRVGSHRSILIGGGALVLGFALSMFHSGIIVLFVSQIIFGISQLLVTLSIVKTIGGLPGDRDRLITAHSMSTALGAMAGPAAGGFIFSQHGFTISCAIATAATGFAFVLGCLVKGSIWNNNEDKNQSWEEASSGWGSSLQLLKNSNLRKALFLGSIAIYSQDLFVSYFPLLATHQGVSNHSIGMLLSLVTGMSILARFLQFRLVQRFGREGVMTTALTISSFSYIMISFTDSIIALTAVIAVFGAANGLCQPLSLVYALNHSPKERHGEVLGIRMFLNRILTFTAPIIFGGVGSLLGLHSIFLSNGGLMLAGALHTRIKSKMPVEEKAEASRPS